MTSITSITSITIKNFPFSHPCNKPILLEGITYLKNKKTHFSSDASWDAVLCKVKELGKINKACFFKQGVWVGTDEVSLLIVVEEYAPSSLSENSLESWVRQWEVKEPWFYALYSTGCVHPYFVLADEAVYLLSDSIVKGWSWRYVEGENFLYERKRSLKTDEKEYFYKGIPLTGELEEGITVKGFPNRYTCWYNVILKEDINLDDVSVKREVPWRNLRHYCLNDPHYEENGKYYMPLSFFKEKEK